MLLEVAVWLKESEVVFCLTKKEQTITHTTILSYSKTPSDIRAAVVRGPLALTVMHPLAQLFPPALALCLRLSEPLVIFFLMEFGWSAGCFPAKCVCVH